MKKLRLTAVAAAAMFFSVQFTQAQVTGQEQTPVEVVASVQEDFVKIEASELPAEVEAAIERDFAGATVAEAFVAEKDGAKKYKLVLTLENGETKKLYADAQGNWIEKDHKAQQ